MYGIYNDTNGRWGVFAETATSVEIGGVELNSSTKYYHNATDGKEAYADKNPEGANAEFNATTGTLTLNGLNVRTNGTGIETVHFANLTIVLNGENHVISTTTSNAALNGNDSSSFTITGSGSLKLNAAYGIWVWNNATIEGNANIDIKSTIGGIYNNSSNGTITIKDNANVTIDSNDYGIGYDHDKKNTPVINGGTLTVKGTTAAMMVAPKFDDVSKYGITASVNKNGESPTEYNAANISKYKYLKITSNPAVTEEVGIYLRTIGKDSPDNGENANIIKLSKTQLAALGLTDYYWEHWVNYGSFQSAYAATISDHEKQNRDSDGVKAVIDEINSDKITKKEGITFSSLDKVTWDTLSWSQNSSGPNTWHLNGEVRLCKIEFNLNGGTGDLPAQYAVYDTNLKTGWPEDLIRTGYTFAGWYTDANSGTKITDAYKFTKNEKVYAHWTKESGEVTNPDSVKINNIEMAKAGTTYYKNNGTALGGKEDDYNAKYEPITKTLTLRNLTLQGNIVADCDLNLVLEGKNTINSGDSNGIKVMKDLIVSGEGSLVANNVSNSLTTVYAYSNITINGGARVTAIKTGGGAQAINADDGSITVSGNDTKLVAINNGSTSYAIKADAVNVSNSAGLTAIQGGNSSIDAVCGTVTISEGSAHNKVFIGNAAQHWHECTTEGCNVNKDKKDHTFNTEGNQTVCSECGYISEMITHTHVLTKEEAKAATCTENGNNEYYKCETCNKVFRDAEGKTETTVEKETLPTTRHNMTKTEAKAATCTETGNNEYYKCETCNKVFQDEAGRQLTTVEAETLPAGHSFEGDFISRGTEGHAQKCKNCDTYDEVKEHEFDGNTCKICGYTKQSSGSHYKPVQKPVIEAGDGCKTELGTDGTKVTITVEEGYELVDVLVNGISKGKVTELTGLKTGDKVEIKTEKIPEKLEPQAVKNIIKELKLVARSERLSNGNVRIKVTKITDINDNPVDLDELERNGYTVKFKYYRSVKKSAGYDTRLEKDADINSYINNFGDKGTKYYYKVKVMVYDADGNLVAQSSLNQCKYAMRTWIK